MAYKIACLIFIVATCHSYPYGPHGSASAPSKAGSEKLVPIDWVGSYDGSLDGPGSLSGHDGSTNIGGGQKDLGSVSGRPSQGAYGGLGNKGVGTGYSNKDVDGNMREVVLSHGPNLDGPIGGLVGSSFVPISSHRGYGGIGDKEVIGNPGESLTGIGGGHGGGKDTVGQGGIEEYSFGPTSSHGGYRGKDGSKVIESSGRRLDGLGGGHGSKGIIGGQSDRYIFGSTASDGAYAGEDGMKDGVKEVSYGNDGLIAVHGGGKDVVYGRRDIAGYNNGPGGYGKIRGSGTQDEFDSISGHKGFAGGYDGLDAGNYGGVGGQRGFDDHGSSGYGNHGHRGSEIGGHHRRGGYGSGGYSHGY